MNGNWMINIRPKKRADLRPAEEHGAFPFR